MSNANRIEAETRKEKVASSAGSFVYNAQMSGEAMLRDVNNAHHWFGRQLIVRHADVVPKPARRMVSPDGVRLDTASGLRSWPRSCKMTT